MIRGKIQIEVSDTSHTNIWHKLEEIPVVAVDNRGKTGIMEMEGRPNKQKQNCDKEAEEGIVENGPRLAGQKV